jgi:heme O synthase-like polyprenyltransferase
VWILLSEIFPASSKGRAMALATSVNWTGNVIVSGTFLQATGVDTVKVAASTLAALLGSLNFVIYILHYSRKG